MKHLFPIVIIGLLIGVALQRQEGPAPVPELGSKRVAIVWESGTATPAATQAVRNLRDGSQAKHFADKAIKLDVVDKDATNESGDLAIDPKDYTGKEPPVLIIYRRNKPAYVEAIPKDFTADKVVSICEGHGA